MALVLDLLLDKGRAQAPDKVQVQDKGLDPGQVLDLALGRGLDKEIVVLDHQVDQIRTVKVKVKIQEMVAGEK